MKIKLFIFATPLIFSLLSDRVEASDPIEILVAQSPGAVGEENIAALANSIESNINNALSATGISAQKRVIAHPHLIPTTFVLDSNSSGATTAGLNHLKNAFDPFLVQNGVFIDSSLTTARNTVVPGVNFGYDLVVMLIDSSAIPTNPPAGTELVCGAATFMGNYGILENSEKVAFMVLESHPLCAGAVRNWVIAHEFSHLLGGEHQIIGLGGIENDASPTNPVNYNHPSDDSFGTILLSYTITGSPESFDPNELFFQYSRSGTGVVLGDTNMPEGTPTKDMFRVISDNWDDVAAYRPLPPPPSNPSCPVQFVTCTGNVMMTAITPALNEPYAITSIDYDTSSSSNGPWTDYYEGPSSCVFRGASFSFWSRLIVNTSFGSSSCTQYVYVNPWNACSEEEW